MGVEQTEMFHRSEVADMTLGSALSHNIGLSLDRFERTVREFKPTHIISLVSGGRDSAAQFELAREAGFKIDMIMHIRTGTGIQETTDFVTDYYGKAGPDFAIADAGTAYEEYVERKGFFGVGRHAHNYAYRILKAQPLRKAISKEIRQGRRGVRILLLNGARKLESDNRAANLQETRRDPASANNIWTNLIHDWSTSDRDRYLRLRDVPINPVAVQLCRSGECMCGTMQSQQSRWEAAAIYPEWAAQLDDLEKRAKAKHGWGWGENMPKPADPRQIEMFSPMCVGCARDNQRDIVEGADRHD